MALKRVTMQQIADACGLSRNTVSKVFNGRGKVPTATRDIVLSKAQELGYYQYTANSVAASGHSANIAVLTQHKLLSHNFGAYFITSFTDQISRSGYTMQMYEVTPEELASKTLPSLFDLEQITGILGIELFDRDYIEMVCSLGKPTVFVDGFARAGKTPIECDFVSMENTASETAIVRQIISAGAKRLGFVGDYEHCNSFYERWFAFRAVLEGAGLPYNPDLCILKEDSILYRSIEWLRGQLDAMPEMPDAFVCANDFLAIQLMGALRQKGFSVPEDVLIAGFDGSPESAIVNPSLTTARIPSTDIGRLAAAMLIERIKTPDFPYRWTYVKTSPVWGDSTSRDSAGRPS